VHRGENQGVTPILNFEDGDVTELWLNEDRGGECSFEPRKKIGGPYGGGNQARVPEEGEGAFFLQQDSAEIGRGGERVTSAAHWKGKRRCLYLD